MSSFLLDAAERAIERLQFVGAEMQLHTPPLNPLTDEQQVRIYQTIVASPVLTAQFKLGYGLETWDAYREQMMAKSKQVGAVNLNLDPMIQPPDKDVLGDVAQSVMDGMMGENVQPSLG